MELFAKLLKELHDSGFTVKTTSVGHIGELAKEITAFIEQKQVNEIICQNYLSRWLNFDYREALPAARSIFIIAHPQWVTPLHFEYQGKNYRVIIPPAYDIHEINSKLERLLNQVLAPAHYSFQSTSLPEKLLAVRTGLGVYGRNNICYVNGMGYHKR